MHLSSALFSFKILKGHMWQKPHIAPTLVKCHANIPSIDQSIVWSREQAHLLYNNNVISRKISLSITTSLLHFGCRQSKSDKNKCEKEYLTNHATSPASILNIFKRENMQGQTQKVQRLLINLLFLFDSRFSLLKFIKGFNYINTFSAVI